MALVPIPGFTGSSYVARSRGFSAARTVNFRVESQQPPAGTIYAPIPISKSPFVMYPRSGKKLFCQLPLGPTVGAWANIDRVFVAAGGNLYELMQDGTTNLIGAIQVGSNPVTMRANGGQLLVVSGGKVYIDTGTQFYQPIINYNSGIVNVAGVNVTWVSGLNQFVVPGGTGSVSPGDLFMINGVLNTVATVDPGGLLLTVVNPAGTINGATFQAGQSMLTGAMCEYIDGYFIVNVPDTNIFRISAFQDGTSWYALDFGQKNGTIDNIGAIISIQGVLALIGDTDSTELWQDSGNANFPFARINGATLNLGAYAPWSVTRMVDGSICMLMAADQGNNIIVQSSGGSPIRISNYAVENAIRKYSRTNDAIGSSYVEDGHSFYRIDFPTANATWEYDQNTQVWAELGVATAIDEVYGCDRGRYTVTVTWPNQKPMRLAFDYLKAADGVSGNVWQVNPDYLDDDGFDFPVMRIAPHINTNLEWAECSRFSLDCELGTIPPGINGPDGKELIPTVQMLYSDDGGNTYIDCGAASLGRVGEYEGTYLRESEVTDTTPNSQEI